MQLFRDCMVFPTIVGMSDNFWSGRSKDRPEFRRRLPFPGSPLFADAVDLERRIAAQRDRTLAGFNQPFPFVRQTHLRWRLTDAKTGEVIAKNIAQGTVWIGTHGSPEAAFSAKSKNPLTTVLLAHGLTAPDCLELTAGLASRRHRARGNGIPSAQRSVSMA